MARTPRPATLEQARAVVDAAARLFAQRGYHGTSMRNIAEEFSLNPGSLYLYIRSKEQLLQSICEFVLDLLERNLDDVESLGTDSLTALRLIARGELGVHVEHRDWYLVYETEYRHLTGDALERVLRGRRALDERLQKILRDGEAQGVLRPLAPQPIASAAFSENLHRVYERVGSTGGISVAQFADTYTDVVLDGWRPRAADAQ
ncbi:TetR/AcrR family transcriptional regulator [Microbacterium sp. zg-Y818]|uniref:TetR/AcrR family transcriptional regulator n=1 Tax=unclassified Microbacterium TaxID=2609290 RepID=UPI00214AB989|nr:MULTISPECIES: TetR/AcrR family transcriptional regulator [unclassified Microbacterium]MCR2799368.1 TetR/AcrR family transcriptional regulator [Microbacterium sp. zg.Y818]WIM21367.1 TetR/AcrR family transcriptional regulator [Microbacterium sp. zg-Y818]